MQLGPVRFSFGGAGPAGVWMSKNGGPDQNITIPVVVGAALLLVVFCCCARVVF